MGHAAGFVRIGYGDLIPCGQAVLLGKRFADHVLVLFLKGPAGEERAGTVCKFFADVRGEEASTLAVGDSESPLSKEAVFSAASASSGSKSKSAAERDGIRGIFQIIGVGDSDLLLRRWILEVWVVFGSVRIPKKGTSEPKLAL